MKEILETARRPKVSRRLYAITVIAALLVLALVLRGPEETGRIIADDSGNAVRISRRDTGRTERYDMILRIGRAGEIAEREVTITMRPHASSRITPAGEENEREKELEAEIDSIITGLEYADGSDIELPESLSDGTRLSWKAAEKRTDMTILMIPALYAVLAAAVIKAGMDEDGNEEARLRNEIMRSLPRFCNQLFLMMNAGLILSDAFEKICSSYRDNTGQGMTWFEQELAGMCASNKDHRIGTADLIHEFAARYNVKELVRISVILSANEKRGSDIIDDLSRESRYLWDDRKIVARERGRMIDTRMSYPLGGLLILLIIITMAPALLAM